MIILYKTSLLISAAITIIGALTKIMHWPGAGFLLSYGIFIGLIYIVIALIEIYKTESKPLVEKMLWLIGFIVLSWIVGLIYYVVEMKPKYKIK